MGLGKGGILCPVYVRRGRQPDYPNIGKLSMGRLPGLHHHAAIQFTQEQVDNARRAKTGKSYLTKADIDSHAEMIMQNTGSWGCIDFMLPYMTADGLTESRCCMHKSKGADA